jgi:hypothetical protein
MIVILVAFKVNLSIIIILVIFIGLLVSYSKTLLGLNSFKHVDHLSLQFHLNCHKSITKG